MSASKNVPICCSEISLGEAWPNGFGFDLHKERWLKECSVSQMTCLQQDLIRKKRKRWICYFLLESDFSFSDEVTFLPPVSGFGVTTAEPRSSCHSRMWFLSVPEGNHLLSYLIMKPDRCENVSSNVMYKVKNSPVNIFWQGRISWFGNFQTKEMYHTYW